MSARSNWSHYLIALALLGALLVTIVPAAWAAPAASPLRQTVPMPTPTPPPPTPAPPAEDPPPAVPAPDPGPGPELPAPPEEQLLAPGQPLRVVVPVGNDSDTAMAGCAIVLDEVRGIEYLVDDVLQQAPYRYPLDPIGPGEASEFAFVVRLSEDALPCASYTVRAYLSCADGETLLREVVFTAPCALLPAVGG